MKVIITSGIAVVHILFTLIACTSSGDSRYAYWTNSHYVDQIFTRWNKPNSPGAAVVVLKNGSIVHQRGYGKANLKNGTPITPSTVFEVGSIAKQFTAMSIALLAERGKISLDDDIRKYVPEVADFGKPITIRHLIYHTSGLRNWEVLFKLAGYRGELNSRQVLDMVCHQKELNFDPGEEYTYCNSGYLLLAEVVQRVTRQSFPEWSRANIFDPLEMTNTSFCDDLQKMMTTRAIGYMPNKNGGFREIPYAWAVPGPTSLSTTAEDLAKWMNNFTEKQLGGTEVGDRMIQQGVLNNGTTLDYAFGLVIDEYNGLKRIQHEGGWSGFRSVLVFFPQQDFGVVILGNLGLGAFSPMPLANRIVDIYLSDQLVSEKTQVRSQKKVNPNIYNHYTGRYVLPLFYSKPVNVDILKDNKRLFAQMQGQARVELLPISETTFRVKQADIHVTFVRNEHSEVEEVLTRFGKWKRLLPARKEQSISPSELKKFVGNYHSRELSTTWTVYVHEQQLRAKHESQEDVWLIYTGAHRFVGDKWWFQQIEFYEDDTGRINGFKLSAEDGLVRNLRFEKISAP
jgi:CubicO group peptidase (beta-lactamase class C family)